MPPRKRAREPSLYGPLTRGGKYRSRDDPAYMASQRRALTSRSRRASINLARAFGIEKKYYDTSLAAGTLTAPTGAEGAEQDPGTILTISAPAQGDTESTRDGREITLLSAQINGYVVVGKQANQTATDNYPVVTIFLVLDRQTNGAQLNSEDVFVNPSGNSVLAAAPFRDLKFPKRFKILAKETIACVPTSLAFDGTNLEINGAMYPFSMYKKLDLRVAFTGTAEGIASVQDNSLHVIAYCSTNDTAPELYYNARVRFTG